jgi:hypothetical protein
MFESSEPPGKFMARQWPILFYGAYCLVGLVSFGVNVSRNRLSHPASLAVACLMFVLSLTWLITTLRSGPPIIDRRFSFGVMTLALLLILLISLPSSL